MSGDHTKYCGTAELQKQIIEVTTIEEHEDGSATIEIETSPDVTAMLIGLGLTQLVKKAIEEGFDDEVH